MKSNYKTKTYQKFITHMKGVTEPVKMSFMITRFRLYTLIDILLLSTCLYEISFEKYLAMLYIVVPVFMDQFPERIELTYRI